MGTLIIAILVILAVLMVCTPSVQILGTGYQRAGDQSRIGINNGAQYLNWASWSVGIKGQDIDTLNFGSYVVAPGGGWTEGQSFEEGMLGPVGADCSYGGLWDAHENVLDDPPGLFPRDDLENVDFVINRSDATEFSFPYQRIRGIGIKTGTKEGVAFDVQQAMSQGPFGFPTASV